MECPYCGGQSRQTSSDASRVYYMCQNNNNHTFSKPNVATSALKWGLRIAALLLIGDIPC